MPFLENQSPEPELEALTRPQILLAIGATALVLWGVTILWRDWGQVPLFPWSTQSLGFIPLGFGLGIAIAGVSSLIYQIWPAYRNSADFYLALILKPLIWPDLLWLGLLPGLSEELLFRGVMLPALTTLFQSVTWGLLASSLCFGLLHLSSLKQWPYGLWATVVGLILGGSALMTHNLLVAIVAHMTTNWLSSGWWKWQNRTRQT